MNETTKMATGRVLTLKQLENAGACPDARKLFKERFGDSVVVTEELCESVALEFGFNWAADNLLSAEARVEFYRVRDAALAEYGRVCDAAGAEYRCVHDSALAEYNRVCDAAGAEFERVRAKSFANTYCLFQDDQS